MAYDTRKSRQESSYGREAWLSVEPDRSCRGSFPYAPWIVAVATVLDDNTGLKVAILDTFKTVTVAELVFKVDAVVPDATYPADGNGHWVLRCQDHDTYPWALVPSGSTSTRGSALIPGA